MIRSSWYRLARRSLVCLLTRSPSSLLAFHGFQVPSSLQSSTSTQFTSSSSSLRCLSMQTPQEVKLTEDCKKIINAGIEAVNPVVAVRNHFRSLGDGRFQVGSDHIVDLKDFDNIVLVAFGKASSAMASAVVDQLEAYESLPTISGIVIVKDHPLEDKTLELEKQMLSKHNISVLQASHPIPDERSATAAKAVLDLVRSKAAERTLVISCISGGGSALFCAPHGRLTLEDLQRTNDVLLKSGLDIRDMNVVRKRLELGKGGRLAEAAYPGTMVALILSDVLGDPLDLIASGPTVPDSSDWNDAWKLVQQLPPDSLPPRVMQLLSDGVAGDVVDSPPPNHPAFSKSFNCVIGNNALAVMAAARQAENLGYSTAILGTQIQGEAKDVAQVFVAMAQQVSCAAEEFRLVKSLPAALIGGGETTVSIPSDCKGIGGRNQELSLAGALALKKMGLRQVVLASVGTDGSDGPTDAAGGIVDGATVDRLQGDAVHALTNHDAYNYLSQQDKNGMSPLLKTGPTGTNVADIIIALIADHNKENSDR